MCNKQTMLKLKKIGIFLLCCILISGPCFHYTWWLQQEEDPHRYSKSSEKKSDPKVDNEDISKTDPIWQWSHKIWSKSHWILQLPHTEDYDSELWYFLALVKIAVNWILWILAFIALVYMLYCGYLVLSSWSDDKNAWKGKQWIKTAAIVIAWIGLSWLIISAMIWFINVITKAN